MMQLQCLLPLLFFIPNVTLSQKDKGSTDPATIGSSEKLREGNNNDNPTQTNFQSLSSELFNNTKARDLHVRVSDANKCKIRNANHKSGPTVMPADSSHIWVSWDWMWFYTHCYPCRDDACDPDSQMIVLVDGEPQTIQLRDNTQHFALVKADPCLKHEITMKVFSFSEKTKATTYNSNIDKSLYSGYLHQTINQRICLNKDNSTVKVLEVFESLMFCIKTEGDQKFVMTELTSNTAAGSVDLIIVNPDQNMASDQPNTINITVPVIGIGRCNNSGDEEDEGNPDLTTIRTTSTSSDREYDGKISLVAYYALNDQSSLLYAHINPLTPKYQPALYMILPGFCVDIS